MSGKRTDMFFPGVFMLLSMLYKPVLLADESTENSVTIVYDNIPGGTSARVQVGGGFSAFVVFKGMKILFDTGADATLLLNNLTALNVDIKQLRAVMISHNHWDHVYGLPAVVSTVEQPPNVFVPVSAADAIQQQNPGAKVIAVSEPLEIFPGVWSTGSIDTRYRNTALSEQSLILNGDDGLYVITGCAHVGIVNIIERARQLFGENPILVVTGGFHLVNANAAEIRNISSRLRQLGVRNIGPSHCTGDSALRIFEADWGEHYLRLYLGKTHVF